MSDFFEMYETASAGDRLSRIAWGGEKWVTASVEAPGSIFEIDLLILETVNSDPDPWFYRMADMAESDWIILV